LEEAILWCGEAQVVEDEESAEQGLCFFNAERKFTFFFNTNRIPPLAYVGDGIRHNGLDFCFIST
jgi:hypothetical protein